MIFSFRWFGPNDPVSLAHIRQIPGVTGIVGALFDDFPPGEPWTHDALRALKTRIADAGLQLTVIESIPVHESIKLGSPDRDRFIEAYQHSIRALGDLGIGVLCYNFMPVFDWVRTDLALPLPDGSCALAYHHDDLTTLDFPDGLPDLPAWANRYDAPQLRALIDAFRALDDDALFHNLAYFLRAVVPVAESAGVRLALHPDDPPWSLFGLPRIVRDAPTIQRILDAVPSPANGLTFCTGSLAANHANDLPAMIRQFAGRIHFAHLRNIRRTSDRDFHESPHPSPFGDVDMLAVMRALVETGFNGPLRPDHGRMIWGETGRPGYGLHDRALGIMYLQGLYEALRSG